MRTDLSTVLQTLTPEAAGVLNHAIAEAGRRNHGQTTPLHVADTLLRAPAGFLRQACIRSHPNSSHPLQCRALELCFSVALDRLPNSQGAAPGKEPPISNALMAALKRAQAQQRRGCPELQQQPLLAVKVELEQLIISILDDPGVSRVMREASFSSPAVKHTIELSLNASASSQAKNPSLIGLGFRPAAGTVAGHSQYLNPRLQRKQHPGSLSQPGARGKGDDLKQVVDILTSSRRRNPVLVGDSEAESVLKELLRRIDSNELREGVLKNVQVISLEAHLGQDRTQTASRIEELGYAIESRMGKPGGGGVVLNLGDLRWLVEQPAGLQPEAGRAAAVEMGKLVGRFRGGCAGRLWLVSTATCETYLRCKVYHPAMENDWDLQTVAVAAKAPPSPLARPETHAILVSSIENRSLTRSYPSAATSLLQQVSESTSTDPAQEKRCCTTCTENYEQELARLSSSIIKPKAVRPTALPRWLQQVAREADAHLSTDQSLAKDEKGSWKQKAELQRKWADSCLLRHPLFHGNPGTDQIALPPPSVQNLYSSTNLTERPSAPLLLQVDKAMGGSLQLSSNLEEEKQASDLQLAAPPGSPVTTDLALCSLKKTAATKATPQQSTLDGDSFKKLFKGLIQKVWWQEEAVSAVSAAVSRHRSGIAKPRGGGSKGDQWLMFTGLDRVGKKKTAAVLAELVCGADPVVLCLGSGRGGGESDIGFRGKTALDRIAEAVRRNPFSLIMIEDVDEADAVVWAGIKRAMERGRLTDSHNREVSLGNVIFILTAECLPGNLSEPANSPSSSEENLARVAGGGWELRLSACNKTGKRGTHWPRNEAGPPQAKRGRETASAALSIDLNIAAEENGAAGDSRNSSDLTADGEEDEHGRFEKKRLFAASSSSRMLMDSVDDAVVFKPVDFNPIRRHVAASITSAFAAVVGGAPSMELEDEALEKILGGVWLGEIGLEEWTEKVVVPSFRLLKAKLPSPAAGVVVRLESSDDSCSRSYGNWLPHEIKVVVEDGLGF